MREAALLPVMVVLIIVGAFVNSAFFAVSNFSGIGQQIAALGVVVVGESLILLIGGMDLSLEGTFGLAPMVAAWLIVPVSAFGLGMKLNPVPRDRHRAGRRRRRRDGERPADRQGRLNGFIVTLGMTIVLAGLQVGIVRGNTLFDLPSAFTYLGAANLGAVPVSLMSPR